MKNELTLDLIKSEISKICKDSSISRVWIFGSYARNDYDEKSDLDLLIELKNPLDIERFDKILGLDVDLMTMNSFDRKKNSDLRFNRNFVKNVENEKVLVYEKH